jgi:hypothetical protein
MGRGGVVAQLKMKLRWVQMNMRVKGDEGEG